MIRYTNIKEPCCLDEIRDKIQAMSGFDIFTVKVDGDTAGVVGCPPMPGEPGVYGFFYHLKKQYWNRGIATESAGWLLRWMGEKYPAPVFLADVAQANTASRRILEGLGFTCIFTGENEFERDGKRMAVGHYRLEPGKERNHGV